MAVKNSQVFCWKALCLIQPTDLLTLNQEEERKAILLSMMTEYNIKYGDIAAALSISRQTLSQRKKLYGLFTYNKQLSQELLKYYIRDILAKQDANLGWKMMQGYLRSEYKVNVGQRRILNALKHMHKVNGTPRAQIFGRSAVVCQTYGN